jgi:hypothetical protein
LRTTIKRKKKGEEVDLGGKRGREEKEGGEKKRKGRKRGKGEKE